MKYLVKIETKLNAVSQEQAEQLANDLRVYHSLDYGGDELDPSVVNVQPLAGSDKLNDMATDELVDHFTSELYTAMMNLENAIEQADVTERQLVRINDILSVAHDSVKLHMKSPLAKSNV